MGTRVIHVCDRCHKWLDGPPVFRHELVVPVGETIHQFVIIELCDLCVIAGITLAMEMMVPEAIVRWAHALMGPDIRTADPAPPAPPA